LIPFILNGFYIFRETESYL